MERLSRSWGLPRKLVRRAYLRPGNKTLPSRGTHDRAPVTAAVEVLYYWYYWCGNQHRCPQEELRLSMHAMRAVSIIAVLLLLVANALELLPVASPFEPYLSGGALVLGLVALVTILAGRGPERATRAAAEAARPMPVPTGANYQADAEIVSFLAMLQARGRLVDFLMDDINTYSDAQVGAAARVVHAGCKAALLEHFQISPVRAESEGATVQIAAGYLPDEYRLVGKISGPAPFSGVLVHHGWKTDAVNLPRVLRSSTNRLPTIAPAEVELK
jgi:Domain of unknown function (DUF2760)